MELGSTGETVRANIRRIRDQDNLTYTQVADRLTKAGRSISPVAVRRIEDGERRVDADDLVSIAQALDVTPITLLMPHTGSTDPLSKVELTGAQPTIERFAWDWLRANQPLDLVRPGEDPNTVLARFKAKSCPGWALAEEAGRQAARFDDQLAAGEAPFLRQQIAAMSERLKHYDADDTEPAGTEHGND